MPVKTIDIIRHLEEQEKREGTLPPLLDFYRKLLQIQFEVEEKLSHHLNLTLSDKAAKQRLECGTPLVSFDELALEESLLDDTFVRVRAVFCSYPELFGDLTEKPEVGHLTCEMAKTWFEGGKLPSTVSQRNERLFADMVQAAMRPFLTSHAGALRHMVDQERWRRGYCPVCGGNPDFAFLDKEMGSRWLACYRCDTEWVFQRLKCPFCGTEDQNALAYFTDDQGIYRLYVCEKCRRYVKAIDLRQAKSGVFLPLERLNTLDIDRQAQEEGYLADSTISEQTAKAKGRVEN